MISGIEGSAAGKEWLVSGIDVCEVGIEGEGPSSSPSLRSESGEGGLEESIAPSQSSTSSF